MNTLQTAGGLVTLAVLSGCAHYPPLTETPKYRIPVHVRADVAIDESTVLMWVDLRADEWIRNKDAWGCGQISNIEMGMFLRAEPIIIHGEAQIWSGQVWCLGYNDYTSDSPQINVTINSPPVIVYSPLVNGEGIGVTAFDYSYGLRQLPHEWTHTARGNWHP